MEENKLKKEILTKMDKMINKARDTGLSMMVLLSDRDKTSIGMTGNMHDLVVCFITAIKEDKDVTNIILDATLTFLSTNPGYRNKFINALNQKP